MWRTLTLFDDASFHEDDTEDHKQQSRLGVGGAPARRETEITQRSTRSKRSGRNGDTHLTGPSARSSRLTSMYM